MLDHWQLKNINWLDELSAAGVARLAAASTAYAFERGTMIFEPVREPQYVYLLEKGLVRIYRASAGGDELTLGYVRPGEIFGELAMFSDRARESYAVAVEPSTVIKVERDVFADVIRSRASVVFSVAKQVGERFKQIESRAEDLVFRSARARLASILLQLAKVFPDAGSERDASGRPQVDIRTTHSELATLIGAARPTVSIALAELEEAGRIRRANGRIVIVDKAALEQEAAAGA